jgi:hypothetical protein
MVLTKNVHPHPKTDQGSEHGGVRPACLAPRGAGPSADVFSAPPIWTKRGRRRMRPRLTLGPHAATVIGVERGTPCAA